MHAMISGPLYTAAALSLMIGACSISEQGVIDAIYPSVLDESTSETTDDTRHSRMDSSEFLFLDDFEYDVSRGGGSYSGTGNPFVSTGGWDYVKAENITGGHAGYLYTVSEIPGYGGSFPGRNSTRVLAVESRPAPSPAGSDTQTDFYLQYGDLSDPEAVPGNVWFQFWIYSNGYDDPTNQNDQLSEYSRMKFLYPCKTSYPCTVGNARWMATMAFGSSEPLWESSSREELYITHINTEHAARYLAAPEYNEFKLGQQDVSEKIIRNRWTLVKLHYDTSIAQGTYEAWMKPMGGQWTKVAEWIDGVTPDFTWNIPAQNIGGHGILRMPTVVEGPDSWIYMDDFAMATSEELLPKY